MNSTTLSWETLRQQIRDLMCIYYFENAAVPEFGADGKPSVFHMASEDIFLVHPNNSEWFRDGVVMAGRIPTLIDSGEWYKRSIVKDALTAKLKAWHQQ